MVVQSGVQLPNDVISSDPIILFCTCILMFPHLYMTDIIPSHHSRPLQILYFQNFEGWNNNSNNNNKKKKKNNNNNNNSNNNAL